MAGGGNLPSTIVLTLSADGSMNLNMGASDIGTGTKTVMAMVVSEELGIKPELIQIDNADTATTQYATPSGGSKTVPTEAPAVRAAAIEVKRQLLEMASVELKSEAYALAMKGGEIYVKDDASRKIRINELPGLKRQGSIVGLGFRGPNPENRLVNPFAAQFCEVEVNTRTGEVRIIRFLGAHDSGRVMNRLTYDSQVIGGVTMGIGFAMTEERVLDQHHTGKRVVPLDRFYVLPEQDFTRETVLEPIEIVTQIEIPEPMGGLRSSYRKVRARRSWDFALAGVALAIVFEKDLVIRARVFLSGAAPKPWRCKEVEEIITGRKLDPYLIKQAADASVRNAQPMEQNGYKIPLFRAVMEEQLQAIARS